MELDKDFCVSVTDKIFILDYDAVLTEQIWQVNQFNSLHKTERSEKIAAMVEGLRNV